MNAIKEGYAILIQKSIAERVAERLSKVASWSDPHRDADWDAAAADPDSAPGVGELKLAASLDDILDAASLANSRWRKTIERIRRTEAATGVAIWPLKAPTQPTAMRTAMAWMLREPKRLMLFDAAYTKEHGESMFRKGLSRMGPILDTGLKPVSHLIMALVDYATPHGMKIRSELEALRESDLPHETAAIRKWLRNYMPVGAPDSPYPAPSARAEAPAAPAKKRGRPSKADLEARRQAAESANAPNGEPARTDGEIPAGEEPVTVAEADLREMPPATPAADTVDAPAEAQAQPDTDSKSECNTEGDQDGDIGALEEAERDALRVLEDARLIAELASKALRDAKAPVPTTAMRRDLDSAWPENPITWPDLVTRSTARRCTAPLRASIQSSASIKAIEASLAANGERLKEIPEDLDPIVAAINADRDQRAALRTARYDAAEQLQEVLSGDVLPALAPEPAAAAAVEAPEQGGDGALRSRIAELETLLEQRAERAEPAAAEFGPEEDVGAPGKGPAVSLVGSLILRSSEAVVEKRRRAIEIVTGWAAHTSKTAAKAVEAIAGGGTVSNGEHEIQVAVSPDGTGWALRYTHPDSQVENRQWTAEATLSLQDGTIEAYAKLYTSGDSTAKMVRTRPGFIKSIVALGGWKDGSLDVTPSLIHMDSADAFDAIVFEPTRRLPTVVISTQNATGEPLLDPEELTKDLHGIAHVALISKQASRDVATRHPTGRLQQWNVYDGAIRVYQPIEDRGSANPIDHRYLSTRAIRNAGKLNAKRRLTGHALEITARTIHPHGVIEFSQILESAVSKIQADLLALPADKQSGDGLRDIIARKDAQIEYWKGEFQAANAMMEDESADKRRAQAEREEMAEALRQAQADLAEAIAQKNHYASEASRLAAAKPAAAQSDKMTGVETHAQLVDLVENHLGPYIVATPACIRDLKKNPQVNVEKVLDCLCLLRSYVDMRHKRIAYGEWQNIQSQSRATDCSYSKDVGVLEGYGDYAFTFEGEKLVAERHLKIGGDPDLRNTARVYYTYHEETRRAVISSMTHHLKVRSTN